jgi:hypothetical protein
VTERVWWYETGLRILLEKRQKPWRLMVGQLRHEAETLRAKPLRWDLDTSRAAALEDCADRMEAQLEEEVRQSKKESVA